MARLACLVFVGCLFSAATPLVGPELQLAEPTYGPAGDNQQFAAAVTRAGVATIVWEDRRDGRSVDLWGTRVSGALPLDPAGVPLVRAPLAQSRPALGLATDTLLLAWVDASVGGCGGEIRAQRFDPSLSPLGPAFTLSTGACNPGAPAVMGDAAGTRWLVTWGGHGAGQEVHGAVVLLDGTVAQADFAISAAANSALAPAVAVTSTGFLVAWEDDRTGTTNIHLATVGTMGQVGADSVPFPAVVPQRQPSLSPSAGLVLLAWAEGAGTLTSVESGTLTEVGAPVLGPFTVRASATAVGLPRVVEVASAAWFVVWDDRRSGTTALYGRRIDGAGSLSAEVTVADRTPFSRSTAALVPLGNEVLAVFHGEATDYINGTEVWGTRVLAGNLGVDPSVVGAPMFDLSTASGRQRHPNAAWNGSAYFVGWRDDSLSPAGSDLAGQLLTSSGQRLLPDAGARLTTNSAILSSYASVAGMDGGFFVSWGDNGSETSLRGRRVTSAGAALALITPPLNDVTSFVTDHDSRWFIDSWVTVFKQDFGAGVALRRTDTAATPLDSERSLGSVTSAGQFLRTAQSGAQLLVVVHGRSDAGLDVYGALWTLDAGLVMPLTSLTPARVGDQINPSAAGSPTNFLVAWTEPGAGGEGDVYASRLSQAGVPLDAPMLLSGAGVDAFPTLTWTGHSYLVAWVRDGVTVVGVRLAEDGVLLDGAPFVLSAGAELHAFPRLVTGPEGESLLTYEVFDPSPAWSSFTSRARFVVETAEPDAGVDAGTADAGTEDAGTVDGGGAVDAGAIDAGFVGSDGGESRPWNLAVGCGCSSADASVFAIALALLFLRRGPAVISSPG